MCEQRSPKKRLAPVGAPGLVGLNGECQKTAETKVRGLGASPPPLVHWSRFKCGEVRDRLRKTPRVCGHPMSSRSHDKGRVCFCSEKPLAGVWSRFRWAAWIWECPGTTLCSPLPISPWERGGGSGDFWFYKYIYINISIYFLFFLFLFGFLLLVLSCAGTRSRRLCRMRNGHLFY